ncbi:M23 family metallopeptidase [Robertmurraya andreesenii]|nr:M23 family metallopeptidase [Robertmurraya andreesenii]
MREEEKKRSSQDSKIKRFMKKRWVYPSLYIAGAAIILTAVLWFQNSNNADNDKQIDYKATDLSGKKFQEDALEVNRAMENFSMPVADPDSVVIQKEFYDFDGPEEKQEAALVSYNNSYRPNTGIDITMENGETFDVLAALSGKVTSVREDALLGNVIEIEHDKGIVTQYQSVTDIGVKVGDQVEQGHILAKAGKSLYNEEAGTHLHFEIRKDGVAVNPIDYFNKPLSALQEAKVTEGKEIDDSGKTDDSTKEEKPAPKEDKSKNADDSKQDKTKDDDATSDEEDADKADSSDA